MTNAHFINGKWKQGKGPSFFSTNPATLEKIWEGNAATQKEADQAVLAAQDAFSSWSRLPFEERAEYLKKFAELLHQNHENFAEAISKDTGKPFWESKQEVTFMIQKVFISMDAYQERSGTRKIASQITHLFVHHKPHGPVAVFGPFNFPGHLPSGHIIPALLAGNTVVFKCSEKAPLVGYHLANFWEQTSLPKGVFNLIQGDKQTGQYLFQNPHIAGFFLTGSEQTGAELLKQHGRQSDKILALEMGGNNPLVVWDVKDLQAAAYLTIQSAFLTAGQRCSCARRLIIPDSKEGEAFTRTLIEMMSKIKVGAYTERPEPYLGPVISLESSNYLLEAQKNLEKRGGKKLVALKALFKKLPFLSPGLIDVTEASMRRDEELFGPFLQLIRVSSFEEALKEANHTQYGLTSALLSQDPEKFRHFFHEIKAGVINWNHATTGASSRAPFGGIKKSGNFHPSGYYAADYTAYPVASMESAEIHLPKELPPGVELST